MRERKREKKESERERKKREGEGERETMREIAVLESLRALSSPRLKQAAKVPKPF